MAKAVVKVILKLNEWWNNALLAQKHKEITKQIYRMIKNSEEYFGVRKEMERNYLTINHPLLNNAMKKMQI